MSYLVQFYGRFRFQEKEHFWELYFRLLFRFMAFFMNEHYDSLLLFFWHSCEHLFCDSRAIPKVDNVKNCHRTHKMKWPICINISLRILSNRIAAMFGAVSVLFRPDFRDEAMNIFSWQWKAGIKHQMNVYAAADLLTVVAVPMINGMRKFSGWFYAWSQQLMFFLSLDSPTKKKIACQQHIFVSLLVISV